jgi:FkbM family methyltransferase
MSEIDIHIDEPEIEQGMTVISARITGAGLQSRRLWYRIEAGRTPDALAIAHAFVVSLINTAMGSGCDLRINGPLTSGLILNLEEYQSAWSRWMPSRFRRINIRSNETISDDAFQPERGFTMAFSGGLDSMHGAWELHRSKRLRALIAIQGLDIPIASTGQWLPTLARLRDCARSINVPLHEVHTNWEDVARDLPGYLGYFLPVIAAGLLMAPRHSGIAATSSYPYDHLTFPLETNPITDPLLGRPGCPVYHVGATAHRIDKVAEIAAWPEALKHLRPCDSSLPDGRACGRCRKCIQTALTFLGLGLPVPPALGSRPPSLDDIDSFQMTPYARLGLRDAVNSARKLGIKGAWIGAVEHRLGNFAAAPAPTSDSGEWSRRLDYVLGGTFRPMPTRILRRLQRTLLGATGPRDLPPLSGPIAPAASAIRSRRVEFGRTEKGNRIFVDPDDLRGGALADAAGNLKPSALGMWTKLVATRRWTHIVDVGANYGEMLVDLEVPASTSIIAVEPNPHVCRLLEMTLEAAGLRVEVVRKAICDREGAVDLVVDRTWSGQSSITVDRPNTSGHRLEPIRVDAITLRSLLECGSKPGDMHVLAKVDVEGFEASVLRSLNGIDREFASFAALIEITQLPDSDIAWILETYEISLLDKGDGVLKQIAASHPRDLSRLLAGGEYHANDVVLHPRALQA